MSAFNPMPDQLQPDSGSPATDVMAPPDQAQAAPAPAPQAAMPPSPDQGGPVPAPQVQQDNPNTHGWRAVLKGALSGLENHLKGAGEGLITGGIPGAVVGAVNPQMAKNALDYRRTEMAQGQQQQAAQIKFTNAEAANTAAEATYRDSMREQMPKELQLRSDQLNETTVKTLASAGVYPEIVVPNTADGPKAAAAQLMDKYGAVPALTYVHVGDALIGYDPQVMSNSSAGLSQVNMLQKITGGPQYTAGSLKMAPAKAKLMDDAIHLFNPPPTGSDKAPDAISRYDGYIRKVKLWSDTDPDKASTLAKLQDARKSLKDGLDAANAEKEKLAQARGAGAANARVIDVDVNGERKMMHAGDAVRAGATSGTGGEKVRAKQAQFQDVMSGIDSVDKAIGGLEQEQGSNGKPVKLPVTTIAALTTALRVTDPKILSQVKDSIGTAQLSPAQRQFAVSILQLNERALSLRNIAGQGQGSDSLRAAVAATLPDAKSGDTDMMRRKLAGFRNFTQNLQQGIQRLPGQSSSSGTPAAPAASSAQPQFTHLSASGKFGWDGSKWVPTGK